MSRARQGYLALAALLVAAVVLIAIELGKGALDGLDGAACELGTTREELVLSFDSELGGDVEWDEETLERALRSGLEEAIADAEERGSLGGLEARILRELVARAPLDWLIEGGGDLADLFGGIFDRR